MKRVLVINGPNLNLLGDREPHLYGDQSLEEIKNYTEKRLAKGKVCVDWFQSNNESDILEKVHRAENYHGIVLNPGALSHSSFALYDCLRAAPCPVVEVHLSNTHGESFLGAIVYLLRPVRQLLRDWEERSIIWEY